MTVRSADLLAANILSDPGLMTALKDNPENVLRQQAAIAKSGTPLETDIWIYRVVVGCIGGVVLLVVIGLIALAFAKVAIPDALVALGSAAIGALAGLLAPSPALRTN